MKCEKVNILWNCGWGWSIKLSPSRRRNLFQRPAKVDFISPPPWQTVTRLKYLRKNRQDAFSKIFPQCGPVVSKKNFAYVSRAHIFGSAPHEELLRRNIEWALFAFFFKHLFLIISEINETLQGYLNTKQNLQNFADERAQYTAWFLDMNNVTWVSKIKRLSWHVFIYFGSAGVNPNWLTSNQSILWIFTVFWPFYLLMIVF